MRTSRFRRCALAALAAALLARAPASPARAAAPDRISAAAIAAITHPKAGDWPTYSGNVDGNRFSPLARINTGNVGSLGLAWVRPLPYSPLETTPLVLAGIMYVTAPNQIYALDARTGRVIWNYSRPRSAPRTVAVDAAIGANRGVAVLGDRLYFITDDAHLLCLRRNTGALLWEVRLPPAGAPGVYGGTVAPLIAGRLVIAGVSGGDQGIRGFLDAYDPITGRRVWRFWTVPKPGDPTYDTWGGDPSPRGGPTWSIGSYDPATGILYTGIGNPYPDTDGDRRQGDDLYTDSDLALEARTGRLLWHFQFTPHDLHDWDANQSVVLTDASFHGKTRQLLLHANRNGFFYVLDRTNGKLLQATPFVKRLNWATGIGANGRPILAPAAADHSRRHEDLSGSARRHELVRHRLRSRDRALLCDDGGGLHALPEITAGRRLLSAAGSAASGDEGAARHSGRRRRHRLADPIAGKSRAELLRGAGDGGRSRLLR